MSDNPKREEVIPNDETQAEATAETPEVVVMFSGGAASAVAALRAKERYGTERLTLLFCDTLIEDEDTYRFNADVAQWLGVPLTRLCDGRTPWQVFHDLRYMGNTRYDPCSALLKRKLAHDWLMTHSAASAVILLGIDACEKRRIPGILKSYAPRLVEFPLLWKPYLDKDACRAVLRHNGIKEPRLYSMGFAHNNCGGFCVRAGRAQFRHLLDVLPERYAYHEAQEQALIAYLGKNVAILRDRRNKKTVPLTMKALRTQGASDQEELWGGCGCFTDEEGVPHGR